MDDCFAGSRLSTWPRVSKRSSAAIAKHLSFGAHITSSSATTAARAGPTTAASADLAIATATAAAATTTEAEATSDLPAAANTFTTAGTAT